MNKIPLNKFKIRLNEINDIMKSDDITDKSLKRS